MSEDMDMLRGLSVEEKVRMSGNLSWNEFEDAVKAVSTCSAAGLDSVTGRLFALTMEYMGKIV